MTRALALLLALTLAGCAQPAVDVDAAMAYLEGADVPVAKLAQAGALHGADLEAWPPGAPVGPRIAELQPGLPDSLWVVHAQAAGEPSEHHLAALAAAWDGAQFGSNVTLTDDAWALIVLQAAGVLDADHAEATRAMLLAKQAAGGGWAWDGGPGSIDETAWVAAAMAATGGLGAALLPAQDFIRSALTPDGAFVGNGAVNCQSTALGMWASSSVDVPVASASWDYLASCQNADGGFAYVPGGQSDWWVTTDVLVSLAAVR